MNFLAHLTLSHFSADLQVGNFVGDFIRGRELAQLPPGIRRGVLMHRAIDALTDADPDVRALNARIRERHGRYAPVVSDVAFDHFLYLNWDRFGPAPFDEFTAQVYRRLDAARDDMPMRICGHIDAIVRHEWLGMYATQNGMRDVFRRMTPRLSRPELVRDAHLSLVHLTEPINQALLRLFPRLQQLAESYRE
ncbi:ACP phosphodiesterase [Lewinella sp. IMCC34183]|uniref:acyl carrier protein phosphodiesterase n=1 Tax=Lewinella sp. IMCC34183 TaxID=2248762 RepID=UPI000E24AB5A|nr:ACP phosphodiesterase [Lewinella sp. IMCC34183]